MKIKKSKFHISQKVTFGGCSIAASAENDQVQISPSSSKVDEILGRDPPKNKKDVQSIVGSVNQMSAWCPGIKRHMPRMRRLTGASDFTWDEETAKEFELIKEEISHHIKLTPFDTRK